MNEAQLIEQAEIHHRNGDLSRAKEFYFQALSENPESADAHYGVATALMQDGNLKAAEDHYQSAAKLEPTAPDIAFNHALCLMRLGSNERALASLTHAYRHCEGDPQFLEPIASKLLDLQKPAEALQALAQLPEGSVQKTLLSARAYGLLTDWGRAVTLLHNLHQEIPKNGEVLGQLSRAAAKLRDYPLAIESYRQYLTLTSPGTDQLLRLADLYLMARQLDEAEATIEKVFEQGEPDGEAWALRARVDRLRGRYEQAIEAAEKALQLVPHHGLMWSLLVELAATEDLPKLKARLAKQIGLEGATDFQKTLMHYTLGDLCSKLNDWQSAMTWWRKANEQQEELQVAAQKDYRKEVAEAQFAKIKSNFPAIYPRHHESDFKPIFIVGMPRSGTTLIERILGQIEGVENCGENETLALIAGQYGLDVQRGHRPSPAQMFDEQWQELANSYSEKTIHHANVITDKLPHNVQHVGFILSCFPNAKVVQMRRNPVAVCWSIYQRFFPEGHNYACNFKSLAHFYRLTDELMNHWAEIGGDRVLTLQYEHLVSDADRQARSLVEYCELPWNDQCLQFHTRLNASFTFSEMQVRDPINTSRIDRWRQAGELIDPLIDALRAEGYEVV